MIGEAPLRYLSAPPRISVRAGDRLLARFVPQHEDVDIEVRVPAGALDRSGGVLTIDTDRTFIPHQMNGRGDRRRLGMRVYQVELREDSRDAS